MATNPPNRDNIGEHFLECHTTATNLRKWLWREIELNGDILPLSRYRPHGLKTAVCNFVQRLHRYPAHCRRWFPETARHWRVLEELRLWDFTYEAYYFKGWSDIDSDVGEVEARLEEILALVGKAARGRQDARPAFARNLDRLRLEAGWSWGKLTNETGFDQKTVSEHLSGKVKKPRPKTVAVYAQALSEGLSRKVMPKELTEAGPSKQTPPETPPKHH